jgi:hypothetical protein
MFVKQGVYADYQGKTYKVSNKNGSKLRLVSEDKEDIKNGFMQNIYPSIYKNVESLPKLYIKEVDREAVNKLYEINYKAKYNGILFNVIFSKSGQEILLGTTDAKLAFANGFERTDKYYYEKLVTHDEVELIKEITDL